MRWRHLWHCCSGCDTCHRSRYGAWQTSAQLRQECVSCSTAGRLAPTSAHNLHDVLQAVLLGDAAHTMSPVMGQGLNVGLEDVVTFAQCMEQHPGNVDAALPAFNVARLPDIQAIMTVNEVVASFEMGLESQVQPAYHAVHYYLVLHCMTI